MSGIKAAYQRRSSKWMRARRWHLRHDGGARHRLYQLSLDHRPWWDWGHRLMTIVGRDVGGNWDKPAPPTWWYRLGPPIRMARTGFPRHPLSTFEVITDYRAFKARTEGMNEDDLYEWQAINVDQDGDLQLGHRYWGKPFYGMRKCDVALLRRYLRVWRRRDWWGLRSWLYAQGLHAAVHAKRPGACNALPPKGQGGYDHWYCRLDRGHSGMHQFNNYRWGDIGGETVMAHVPEITP